MRTVKLTHPVSFLIAALIGLGAGACKHGEQRIESVCKRNCTRLADCNDIVDHASCVSSCVKTAHHCYGEHDLEMALDQLDSCPDEACNDVLGCGTEAWLECKQ